jgi:hypothetical protein
MMVKWEAFLPCIWVIAGSNLGHKIAYPDLRLYGIPYSLKTNAGTIPQTILRPFLSK